MIAGIDRNKLRAKLDQPIDALDSNNHPPQIVNITSGAINREIVVNVEYFLEIGFQQLNFIKGLRRSFSISIKREMVLPKKDKKRRRVVDVKIFDTEDAFVRIICLIGLKLIELETALNYELAPIRTMLFQDNREVRYPKAKSVLKTTLEVTAYEAYPSVLVIDVRAIFWTINCSNHGTVADL